MDALPRRLRPALAAARGLARRRGERLYLAGGAVRDLLLGRPIRDIDLVVEGDATRFAERLAKELDAELQTHRSFGTATLTLRGGQRLDFAGARRETYARSGALPEVVSAASIEEDLARRDFPINAMALEVAPGRRLVDPFGGRTDLNAGRIRFLHPGSPADDPTRAFRAVRYANRLGFRITPEARRSIATAIAGGVVDAVSGDRLRRELARILGEPGRARAIGSLGRLGLAAAVDTGLLRAGAGLRVAAVERLAGQVAGAGWLCYFLAWMGAISAGPLRSIADRLAFAGRDRRTLLAWPQALAALSPGLSALASSELSRRLRGRSPDEVVAAAGQLPARDRGALLRGLSASRGVRLSIRGSDLVAAGVAPGPRIGRALAATLAAREDGRIELSQELEFAVAVARATPGGPR